ncbi:hypothetical protein NX774_12075 [Massilia agilis]|uniref:Cytochrome C n=1 Tax=Massilia agilis TaxID=1811226 RepID=A0ABT2DBK2_9BURK|nr:hypothetical protein [Massilia agilis]MCS0808657.1 hypothetical protein [Massilia agilis]
MGRTGFVAVVAAVILITAGGIYLSKREAWFAIPAARGPILEVLRDPDSAQFRNEFLGPTGTLCGEVNSKNGMGGYVGFKKFIANVQIGPYLEDEGPLGPETHEKTMALLDQETTILHRFNKYRDQIPGLTAPPKDELEKMARSDLFKAKWSELCVKGA